MSVTDLTNCTHGTPPISNCPRCMNKELVVALQAIEGMAVWDSQTNPFRVARLAMIRGAAASVLDRAKLAAESWGDTIPAEDVLEASQDR